MTKRIFAIVLMAALLLTALPVSAATAPTVTAGSVTVTQGSSVSLSVTAASLSSLGSMELLLYYDSAALSVSSVTAGNLFSSEVFDYNADEAGVIRVNAVSFAGVSGSGTVMTVRFTAASTAPAGTYPITVAVGDCYDASLSPVTITATSGSVTVNEKAVNNGSFTLYQFLSASTLKQGDSLTVSVRSPYKYYSSADFLMEYDWELLKLESIELHKDLTIEGAVYSINTAIQGQALITYASTKELSNYYKFTAVFTVIGDVDTTTKISTTAKNVYKADLTAYTPYTVSSALTLEKAAVVPDHKDLTLVTDDLSVGKTGSSWIVLQQGAGVAAGDFTVSYNPRYLRCTGVTAGTALNGGMVMVNPNYTEGTVKFSYINESGSADEVLLLTLTWEVVAAPDAHYVPTLSGKNVVNADYSTVALDYTAEEFCFYDAAVTAPTCLAEGYTVYTCSCGKSYTADYTPMTGHSYTGGICTVCGENDPGYIVKFNLMGTNLTMGNDLDLQFAVSATKMTDWTGCYFELVRTYADGTADDVKIVPIEHKTSGVIIVKYEGLAAKEMGDQITVTVYNADGTALSNPYTDSIASYAVRMLRKATIATQKQLIVDMLAYGAAAQQYLGYNTANPVTNLLTAAERATITTNVNMEHTLDQGSHHRGSNLTIKSNILFQVAMKNVPDDATITATYTTHTGNTVTVDTYTGTTTKILVFDQMVVSDARQVITITITGADGTVLDTCQESIADYLGRQANASGVFKAVMAFSDSAYAYLHRNDK